jgi:hypothetical protein
MSDLGLVTAYLYMLGSILHVPGGVLLLEGVPSHIRVWSTYSYILGCSAFFLAGFIDLAVAILSDMKKRKVLMFTLYFIAATLVLSGALLYLPFFGKNGSFMGSQLYRGGSSCYFISAGLNVMNVYWDLKEQKRSIEAVLSSLYRSKVLSNLFYMCGSVSLLTGGALSQLGIAGAPELWTLGGCWLVVGSSFLIKNELNHIANSEAKTKTMSV